MFNINILTTTITVQSRVFSINFINNDNDNDDDEDDDSITGDDSDNRLSILITAKHLQLIDDDIILQR